MTTIELRTKFFGGKSAGPWTAQQIITGLVRSLVEKTKLMKDCARVFASERAGPKPIEVWLAKKTSR